MTRAPSRGTVTRRDLLRGAGLLTMGALGASACGSPLATGLAGVGPGRRSLTYWNLFTGGDGVRMVAMVDAYQKAHPEVDLNPVTLTWGAPYYTKLSLATLGHRPPDVGISHLDRFPALAEGGLLTPLDVDVLARHGITEQSFTPAAWRQAHLGDTLYAIPLDTHPWVLYYNTEICKKAGLLNKDGTLKNLDGRDGLLDAMTAAKKVTGAFGGAEPIIGDTATSWREFSTLYWQLGGNDVLAANGTRVVLDEAKAAEALAYQAELTAKRQLMPNTDYNGAVTAFSTGKAAFFLQGPWEVTTFLTAKTPFSMTTYPNVFGHYVVWADSHSFVLPTDAARDADRLSLTLEFVRYLLGQSVTWAEGGHVPAYLPVQNGAAYRKLQPQSRYIKAAYAAHYDPIAWYSGAGSNFENAVGSPVIDVKSGRAHPEQAAARMRANLEQYANTPPPVGKR